MLNEINNLKIKNLQYERKIDELLLVIDKLTKENNDLEIKLNKVIEENSNLKLSVESLKGENSDLKLSVGNLKMAMDEINKEKNQREAINKFSTQLNKLIASWSKKYSLSETKIKKNISSYAEGILREEDKDIFMKIISENNIDDDYCHIISSIIHERNCYSHPLVSSEDIEKAIPELFLIYKDYGDIIINLRKMTKIFENQSERKRTRKNNFY